MSFLQNVDLEAAKQLFSLQGPATTPRRPSTVHGVVVCYGLYVQSFLSPRLMPILLAKQQGGVGRTSAAHWRPSAGKGGLLAPRCAMQPAACRLSTSPGAGPRSGQQHAAGLPAPAEPGPAGEVGDACCWRGGWPPRGRAACER